jgi:hypothetical protein
MLLAKLSWLTRVCVQLMLNMQGNSINIWLLTCRDYFVVNVILINNIAKHNKVPLLRLDTTIKPSHISKGVVEIWIDIHLARKNLATWHTQGLPDPTCGHHSQQRSKSQVGSHLFLVYVFHVLPLWAIRGWLIHCADRHHCRRGEISSNSVTVKATKFMRPHK